jgi:hypothetical protein
MKMSDINKLEITAPAIMQTPNNVFLQTYGFRTLGMTTIARWMYAVGFQCKQRGKHYFVDGHKRPKKTRAYQPVFTDKYKDKEIRAHHCMRITLKESKEMESFGQVPTNCSYDYVDDDGTDMIECGVDASYNFRRDYLRFHSEKA